MSAGAFAQTRYESNEGGIFNLLVQPETIAANIGAANAPPAGAVTQEVSAQVSKGKRSIGMNVRTVSVRFTAALPEGYLANQIYRVPILTPAVYNPIRRGATGTYLGLPVRVVGKTNERSR